MAASPYRSHPPYAGAEPYLYLCFAREDEKSAASLLAALAHRGCRVWYSLGLTADREENARRTERIRGAALTVLLLREETAFDGALRGNLGYCLSLQKPVITVELSPLSGETGLDLLLGPNRAARVQAGEMKTPGELAAAIMRTQGFSQGLFDPQARGSSAVVRSASLKRIACGVLLAAMAAVVGAFLYGQSNHWFQKPPADTVQLSDATVRDAARTALSPGGQAALTRESLEGITTLRLARLPVSLDALHELPNLTRLEIPQSAVPEAAELLATGRYTVVVYGEAEP